MPIAGISPRLPEIGRLRMGTTEPIKGKKGAKITRLDTWRLTSAHLEAINAAAKLWGGEVSETEFGGELITETAVLQVLVPDQDLSQYLEAWSGGGLVRRCDGVTEMLSDGPCLCAGEEERTCKPTTQLLVVLPELPGLGVWRLVTRGYNAAAELQASLGMIRQIEARGALPHAELVLEQRTKTTGGETHRFAVPVLRLPYTLAEAGLTSRAALPSLPPAGVDPDTGEILDLSAPEQAETPAAGSASLSPAAGTTSAPEEPELGTPAAVEYGADDDPGPEATEETSSENAGTASGRRDCLHLEGTRSVPRSSDGGLVEVCVGCGRPLEVSR